MIKARKDAIGAILLLSVIFSLSWAVPGLAQDAFGVVMTSSGEITLERKNKKQPLEIGMELEDNDILILKPEAETTVISYDCMEWRFKEVSTVLISLDDPRAGDHFLKPEKVLDAYLCPFIKPFIKGDSPKIGGLNLRSFDLVKNTRTQCQASLCGETTLIVLILHDLAIDGRGIDSARPYYRALKKNYPNSRWGRQMASVFESVPSSSQLRKKTVE